MMKLHKDIQEFVGFLNSENIEFLLVGGYALAFHGAPRFTEDIDFLIAPNSGNGVRMETVLKTFGFGELGVSGEDFQQPNQVIQLGRAPNRIALMTGIDGVGWEEAWESRQQVELGGHNVWVVSREVLIKNKQASGRPQDMADVARLQGG